MYSGTIKLLKEGWGFIGLKGQDRDVFFHKTDLENIKFRDLTIGQDVEFEEIVKTDKGYQAKRIRAI